LFGLQDLISYGHSGITNGNYTVVRRLEMCCSSYSSFQTSNNGL